MIRRILLSRNLRSLAFTFLWYGKNHVLLSSSYSNSPSTFFVFPATLYCNENPRYGKKDVGFQHFSTKITWQKKKITCWMLKNSRTDRRRSNVFLSRQEPFLSGQYLIYLATQKSEKSMFSGRRYDFLPLLAHSAHQVERFRNGRNWCGPFIF